jgi:hypothetical protein
MAMAGPTDRPDRPDSGAGWHEIVATALLVITAVATSWSSYQATRWHGEQAATANRTSAIRIQGASAASLGEAETQVDVATFIAWVNADQAKDKQLADFYVARFRPEFKIAFDAWEATRPLTNPSAPPTPFAMPEYQVAHRNEAARLNKAAEVSAAKVGEYIQRASNYVLTVVLYAVVLFFAGMSTKLRSRRLRTITVVAGCLVLVVTLTWIATFPVSVKV